MPAEDGRERASLGAKVIGDAIVLSFIKRRKNEATVRCSVDVVAFVEERSKLRLSRMKEGGKREHRAAGLGVPLPEKNKADAAVRTDCTVKKECRRSKHTVKDD